MPPRRILSLWFPRLAAERVLRRERGMVDQPFAVVCEVQNGLSLASLSAEAEAEGLHPGQALSDARAFCPQLLTTLSNPLEEKAFLTRLQRWAGKYSPWVACEGPASLVLDISGCAHLFGGEEALAAQIRQDCQALRLTLRIGIADNIGAAWALARFSGQAAAAGRNGDSIDQEARATRSRAFKRRHWERGGPAPLAAEARRDSPSIAPPGQSRQAIAPLPLAALRLDPEICTNLTRLGIRSIADLTGLPRASLARRFGQRVVQRLDQALGAEPEPISPIGQAPHFVTRLTLPEPIGLEADFIAGLDRLLPPLCDKLRRAGRGVRSLRFHLYRVDHTVVRIQISLTQPSHDPARIRPLLLLKLGDIDAGFGVEVLRLEASQSEPLNAQQHKGHLQATTEAQQKRDGDTAMADLLGRLGARIGQEALTLLQPADSHIPEKTARVMMAAYAQHSAEWPQPSGPRPLVLFPPEALSHISEGRPPTSFQWRRRAFELTSATGPERICPEWWLDDPNWRSGTRDYWRVETKQGPRLWLFQAHGGETSGGWFCQGDFD